MSVKRSIVLRGCPEYNEYGVANEAIKPGYLVKGVATVSKQTASVSCPFTVAVERDELGAGIDDTYYVSGSGAPHAAYASGDTVKVAALDAGDEATVFVASGANITEGDYLNSAGNGLFSEVSAAYASGTGPAMAMALETLGAVAVETAVRVRVI